MLTLHSNTIASSASPRCCLTMLVLLRCIVGIPVSLICCVYIDSLCRGRCAPRC
ncbi:hypothetical protein GQ44DRAFT_717476, partial [Phaeosphaeriaceae sp. PMI808]